LYAHPDDWPAIKALAEKLQRRRAKKLARHEPANYEVEPPRAAGEQR
jgi:hypothetical protein